MDFLTNSCRRIGALLMLMLTFVQLAQASTPINSENDKVGTITGKVTTTDGTAAPHVNVQLLGTEKVTQTGEDGKFTFRRVPVGNYTVRVTLLGFAPVEKAVQVEDGKTQQLSIELEVSSKQLKEVIISSGTQNKFTKNQSSDVGKMPLKNLENAQVYTTLTKELLTSQLSVNVDDAIKNVPGITKMWDAIARPGSGGSIYTMRGFVTQPNMRNGIAGYTTNRLDATNLERLEVIKGPSATLFGNSLTSYGGLINRVTKKPYDHVGGEVAYTGGTYGYNRLALDFNTPLDSAKTTLFRLNGSYQQNRTWQDFGNSQALNLAPSISYKANERLSFLFEAEFTRSKGTIMPSFFFYPGMTMAQLGATNAKDLKVDYKRAYFADDLQQKGENNGFFTQANYKMSSNWSTQTNLSYTSNTASGPTPYFYLLPGGNSIARMVWEPNGTDKTFEIQQNFNGDFHIGQFRNRFVGGVDFYAYDANIPYRRFQGNFGGLSSADLFDMIAADGKIPTYQNFNKAKVDSAYASSKPVAYNTINRRYTYSAYISDVFNITDNLLIQAGVRIDHFDNRGNRDVVNDTITGKYNQTALSPKFGIVYEVLKDRVSVFGNYQNGFTNKNGQDENGKSFKPEQANQWEGGVKVDVLGGRISGTVSYYDITVTDVVRANPSNPLFSIQDGQQRSKGIEVAVTANPLPGLNFIAGYSYNDSKFVRTDANTEGFRPTTSGPANLANLWLNYNFTSGAVKGLGFGIGGNYASDNKVVNNKAAGTFMLPSYTLVDASINYETSKIRLAVKCNNIGNQKYWTGYSTANPQMLRQLLGSIAFKF
ncbi:iron complex outermembrane receptor protein [Chitinophaga skermanii]|uniref:Iron complex outermembrane receptor protein n=1 Tax=Chitinophaga skermanii TaxID=331697 RepID=A0A327R4M5_9BACT|nr:TonB-dependent receptor [Chitinophaga skermanii]RAJ10892.1 iron complex outermembrane receptor protein [Chitinophaga skermanii]